MCKTNREASEPATPFAERMLGSVNEAALMLMLSIGHRTGLFDTMSEMSPATCADIANRAGLNERYVREWLGAMVTGDIVQYDAEAKQYDLPQERAACLTTAAGADNMASMAQWIAVLGAVEDEVTEAFTHGRGVPYTSYKRFHEVMADESEVTVVGALDEHILPLVPELEARLEAGVQAADVGCGSGRALLHLARRFPNSQFVGVDFSLTAIANARAQVEQNCLTNIRFEVQDAAQWKPRQEFDILFSFDAIHDQARPDQVLKNIRQALRPGGVYLMQEIGTSSHVEENCAHPLAPLIYTISCMHCMSVSLAAGGLGLGAAWGKQQAMAMLAEVGFTDVEIQTLEHDLLNYYYICRA